MEQGASGAEAAITPSLAPHSSPVTGRRRLLQDSASLASGQIMALAAAAVGGLLAARWLGPQGRGQLVLALAVVSFLGPLAAGGIDSFIASRLHFDSGLADNSVVRLGLWVARWGGAIIAATTIVYGLAVGLPAVVVALGAVVGLIRPTLAVLQGIATGQDRVAALGRALSVSAVTQLVSVLVLSIDGSTVSDFITGSLLGLVVGSTLLVRIVGWPAPTQGVGVGGAHRHRIWKFGGKVVLGDALQMANYRLDVFFLAAFVPIADVGVYAVAVTIVEMLWQLPYALSRSLLPRISGGEMNRPRVVRVSLILGAGLAVLSVAGLALASWLTVPVLGSEYARVPGLLALLLPGVLFIGVAKPLAAWTLSHGFPGRNLIASAIGFVVVVAGDLLLIPRFGLSGAAVASTVGYVVTACGVALLMPANRPIFKRAPGTGSVLHPSSRRRTAHPDEDCVELFDS